MRNWVRRVRGAIGIGLTWGAGWSVVGMIPRWVLGINADAPFPLIFGVLGFFAGVLFSAVLALTERSRRLEEMSIPRFAALGATGGLLLSAFFAKAASLDLGDVLLVAPAFALASAVCAAGSIALAKRPASTQLHAGGNVAPPGVTEPRHAEPAWRQSQR